MNLGWKINILSSGTYLNRFKIKTDPRYDLKDDFLLSEAHFDTFSRVFSVEVVLKMVISSRGDAENCNVLSR